MWSQLEDRGLSPSTWAQVTIWGEHFILIFFTWSPNNKARLSGSHHCPRCSATAQPKLGEYSSGPWYSVQVPKSLYPSLGLFFFSFEKLRLGGLDKSWSLTSSVSGSSFPQHLTPMVGSLYQSDDPTNAVSLVGCGLHPSRNLCASPDDSRNSVNIG